VTFTPFNKAAMRLAHPSYDDEVVFLNEELNFKGEASEFNILPNVWNARVTSHVPISGVAELMAQETILDKLVLTHDSLKAAGIVAPRIAVAGLNPHAGDGGNFGREEIDVIEPAVKAGIARGIACDGPFPSDTVFLRAKRGDFDAVLTMYHDQGQIAMKMMGFDEGVTLLGGYPFPVCTPAHGTAYDIAGRGIADLGATRNAFLLGARMAAQEAQRKHKSCPVFRETMKPCDVVEAFALADEPVLDGVVAREPEAHTGHKTLVFGHIEVRQNRILIWDPGRLGAGVQAETFGGQHDRLDVHANVRPIAATEIIFGGHEQSDGRIEELEIAERLLGAGGTVTLLDAEHSIQRPTKRATARVVHVAPLVRVVTQVGI